MIIPIHPVIIFKDTIQNDWNADKVVKRLEQYFDKQKSDGIIVRDLHKEDTFNSIVNFMNESVSQYWSTLGYDKQYPFEISSMWANLMVGDDFPYVLENHSPAIISVVFYVYKDSGDMGNIYFANPLENIMQTQPLSQEKRYGDTHQEIDTRTGDVLCFPSWLNHGVRPNKTNRKRYIVAADYELKGLNYIKKMMSKK